MSFLIKHQIMHVIRQRQQKKIAEENEFYFDVLKKALPREPNRTVEESEKDKNLAEEGVVSLSSGVSSDHREGRPRISPKSNQSGGGGGKNSNRERTGSSSGGKHSRSSGAKTQDHRSNSSKQLHSVNENSHSVSQGSGVATTPNGDLPRPSAMGKVHVVGGKKQLAVKAVPRTNPPSQCSSSAVTTTQDTIKDKVVCVCVCVCVHVRSFSFIPLSFLRHFPHRFSQTKAALEILQGELRSERALRQVAEAAASKLELEVKKLKADLQVQHNL